MLGLLQRLLISLFGAPLPDHNDLDDYTATTTDGTAVNVGAALTAGTAYWLHATEPAYVCAETSDAGTNADSGDLQIEAGEYIPFTPMEGKLYFSVMRATGVNTTVKAIPREGYRL